LAGSAQGRTGERAATAEAAARLRAAGLRPTRQRLALAGLLFAEGPRHVSAEVLHAEARAARVKVSLATVYNALNQFTAAGLLREIVVEPGRSMFDTDVSHHHHFLDETSGALLDVPAEAVRIVALPAPPRGRRVARVDVVIRLARR